jgi:hypothetical protein
MCGTVRVYCENVSNLMCLLVLVLVLVLACLAFLQLGLMENYKSE